MADDMGGAGGRSRARMKPTGAPVMTNRAALRVLYDLAGKKTWYTLGNELGFRVEDINKKNYPWPSDFGCHEYCAKFQEYAKSEHTSPYAAIIAVRESLIESNAYTPEAKALVDNVRPDSDESVCEGALRRLMETIIETALPYNKLPRPAQPASVGAADSPAPLAPVGAPAAQASADAMATALPQDQPAPAGPAASRAWPGPGTFLLDGRGTEPALRAILPAEALSLAVACAQGAPAAREALVRRLCSDSGLSCRAMQRACSALASNPGVDSGALFAQMDAAFGSPGQTGADARLLSRARGLYLRYCDGDVGRGLLCCTLLYLLDPGGFVRVMACPATRELFER